MKRWHATPRVGFFWDSPPPPAESVRTNRQTDGRTDAEVRTNIFHIDRLPDLLTHGAPMVRFVRWSFAMKCFDRKERFKLPSK